MRSSVAALLMVGIFAGALAAVQEKKRRTGAGET